MKYISFNNPFFLRIIHNTRFAHALGSLKIVPNSYQKLSLVLVQRLLEGLKFLVKTCEVRFKVTVHTNYQANKIHETITRF